MNLPIADYSDYVEVVGILQRRADQIANEEENKKLQEARELAEKYYKIGQIDTGTAILKLASDNFIAKQSIKALNQGGLL